MWCLFFLIFVTVPPNIAGTSGVQDLTVLQNRQIILECKSDAVPPPIISWLKNGELLEVLAVTLFMLVCCSFHFLHTVLEVSYSTHLPLQCSQVTVPRIQAELPQYKYS